MRRSAARSGARGHGRLDQLTGYSDLEILTVEGEVVTDERHPVVGGRVVPRAVLDSCNVEVGRLSLLRAVAVGRGVLQQPLRNIRPGHVEAVREVPFGEH